MIYKMNFDSVLKQYADVINEALNNILNEKQAEGYGKTVSSMSYSIKNGGKRIRPVLTLEFCRVCKTDFEKAIPFACAIEMIHTYSLIHDDLPCMDDDDMRRGLPANHIKFGETIALLAGDALQTLAFETLFKAELEPAAICRAGEVLARAAGISGMVAGQEMDLENEDNQINPEQLQQTDLLKTGRLIECACALGCIAAFANADAEKAASDYAKNLGLAFQIVDDILDVEGNSELLGKPTGSDGENLKSTYVSIFGIKKAKEMAAEHTKRAINALAVFGSEANFLRELAENLYLRER